MDGPYKERWESDTNDALCAFCGQPHGKHGAPADNEFGNPGRLCPGTTSQFYTPKIDNTICGHFQSLAMATVREWDGVDTEELITNLRDALG